MLHNVVQIVQCLNIHKNLYVAIRIFTQMILKLVRAMFKQKINEDLIWLEIYTGKCR